MSRGAFAILALALFAAPLIWLGHHVWQRDAGREIVIDTAGYIYADATPLRIAQVDISINRLFPDQLSGDNNYRTGESIFVYLKQDRRRSWEPVAIARTPGHLDHDDTDWIMVRGTVREVRDQWLRADFGTEHLFLPKGTREAQLEQLSLSVTDDGQLRFLGLPDHQMDRMENGRSKNGARTAPAA